MYEIKELLAKIINGNYKAKINYRVVDDRYILFLNYRTTKDGKSKSFSKRLATLTGNKKDDIKLINDAIIYRDKFEKSLDVVITKPTKIPILPYIDICENKHSNPNTAKCYRNVKQHITKYSGEKTLFQDIDKAYCQAFLSYLMKIAPRAHHTYFSTFKAILNSAINDEIIPDLPFLRKITLSKPTTKREFLTETEIKAIIDTPYEAINYKNAFLFSCFTGLRYIDLEALKFSEIKENTLYFVQIKTKEPLQIPLHDYAVKIIEEQRLLNKTHVFNFKSYKCWAYNITKLLKKANITKKISGHCARHTFATLLITSGVDIFTTSKLLGHTDIKTTQIYAKLVDEKKTEAIKKLPIF
jgi:integrase